MNLEKGNESQGGKSLVLWVIPDIIILTCTVTISLLVLIVGSEWQWGDSGAYDHWGHDHSLWGKPLRSTDTVGECVVTSSLPSSPCMIEPLSIFSLSSLSLSLSLSLFLFLSLLLSLPLAISISLSLTLFYQNFLMRFIHTHTLTTQDIWLKYSAIGFLLSAAGQLDEVAVQCYILPRVLPFLKYPIIQMTDLGVLLSSLREPVPRGVLDFIIKHQNIREIYEWWVA